MKSIENEIEPGHHVGQPRVFFAESTSTQYRDLLASVNLLETTTKTTNHTKPKQQQIIPSLPHFALLTLQFALPVHRPTTAILHHSTARRPTVFFTSCPGTTALLRDRLSSRFRSAGIAP